MTRGPDGEVRISVKAISLVFLAMTAIGGGGTTAFYGVRYVTRMESRVEATAEAQREAREADRARDAKVDSLRSVVEQLRSRLNTILTEQDRRLDAHDRIHGIPPNGSLPK